MGVVGTDVEMQGYFFGIRGFFFDFMVLAEGSVNDIVDDVLGVAIVGEYLLQSVEFRVEEFPCGRYLDGSVH